MSVNRDPRWLGAFLLAGVGLVGSLLGSSRSAAAGPAGASRAQEAGPAGRVRAAYGRLPMTFEANRGQVDSAARFLARGAGYTFYLTPTESVLALSRSGTRRDERFAPGGKVSAKVDPKVDVLRMKLAGASERPRMAGVDKQAGIANYFIGSQENWTTNIPTFQKVAYSEVYPGIDMVCYGNQREVEYDFVLAPGASPDQIRMQFSGATKIEVAENGDLVLKLANGEVRHRKPVIYQETDGVRRPVAGRYALRGSEVGFQLAAYDATKKLVIDPQVSYATYLGGSGDELGNGVAVDAFGNVYVTGSTISQNYPLVGPVPAHPKFAPGVSLDVFVTKINAAGTAIMYSSVLGGSFQEVGLAIAVDTAGKAFVTGFTSSYEAQTKKGDAVDLANYPFFNNLQPFGSVYVDPGVDGIQGTADDVISPRPSPRGGIGDEDAFISVLSPTGATMVLSSYLGGDLPDIGNGVAVDQSGAGYLVGTTNSTTNFPVVGGFQGAYGGGSEDAFVIKVNPNTSSLVYGTYLGGELVDFGAGIAVNFLTGEAFVTGTTGSNAFPTLGPIQAAFGGGANRFGGDAFVAKIAASGAALVYSTYLGGAEHDHGTGIAVDAAGNAYVSGSTLSRNFPLAAPLQPSLAGLRDAFVTKLNPAGNAFLYSTYLGGVQDDIAYGIAVNLVGHAYITGATSSPDFPTRDSLQRFNGGGASTNADAFVSRLNDTGATLVYSSYIGGAGFEQGNGIDVDAAGNAYVIGSTNSADFPVVNALQSVNRGGNQGFDAFLFRVSSVPLSPSGLTAIPIAPTRIDLAWIDNSSDELRFEIERSTGGGAFVPIGTVGPNVATFSDTTVVPGTTYTYRVRAVNAAGDSSLSNLATATTPLVQVNAPTNLRGEIVGSSSVRLNWDDNAGNEDGFQIERKAGSDSFALLDTVGPNVETFTDTGLLPETTYTYRVRAFLGANVSAYSNEVSETTPTVTAPSNLQTALVGPTTIRLSFTDNSDNEGNFEVERKVGTNGVFTLRMRLNANTTTFDDTGLNANTLYIYRVRAISGASRSDFTNESGQTTPAAPPSAPAAPSNAQAFVAGPLKIAVSWQDNSANETSFSIERKEAGGVFAPIATVGANITSYTDSTGLVAGTTYVYRIKALNDTVGDSDYSNEASATATANAAGVPVAPSNLAAAASVNSVRLSWADNSNNESGFRVERKANGGSFQSVGSLPTNTTEYSDGGLASGTTYVYRVSAYNSNGAAASNDAQATTGSANGGSIVAPTNLKARAKSASQIDLTWTDRCKNESSFRIERKTAGEGWHSVGTVRANAKSYSDRGLSANTTYTYRVVAVGSGGEAASNEASAKTKR